MSDDTVQKRSKSVAPSRFSLRDVHLSGVRLAQAVEAILGYAADGARHYVCIFAADSLLKCRDTPHLAAVAGRCIRRRAVRPLDPATHFCANAHTESGKSGSFFRLWILRQ